MRSDRAAHPPYGLQGGAAGRALVERARSTPTAPRRCCRRCSRRRSSAGDVYVHRTAGGGGWGDPRERDPRDSTRHDLARREGDTVIDPITFEVIRNALVAATDEMVLALRRSAYSTNIKTRSDFSCAFFDAELRAVAQGFTQPVHLGSMVEQMPRAIRDYGPENLGPGDVIITNDPFPSGVHLNDVTPDLAGASTTASCSATSRTSPTTSTSAAARPRAIGAFREVFQEGVIIPPVKVVEGGADRRRRLPADPRADPLEARDGRRLPRPDRGEHDRRAAAAGARRPARPRRRSSRRWASCSTTPSAARAPRSRRCRTASTRPRAPSTPTATPTSPCSCRRASRSRADGVRFDLAGSDPQRRAPVNSTYAQTFSACAYALKCLIDPDLPVNDGFYRARHASTRRAGSVTNCTWPAPGRRRLGDADAPRRRDLPRAPPRAARAAARGDEGDDVPRGLRRRRPGRRTSTTASSRRSAAATAAALASDGPDAVQTHGQNTENAPVEETELNYPVRVDAALARRGLRRRRAASAAGSACARTSSSTARRRSPCSPTATLRGPCGRVRRPRRQGRPSTC